MHLYHKTLTYGSNVNSIATGHFLGNNEKQIAILRGTVLSLYSIIDGTCVHILSSPIFGVARCIDCLHIMEYMKDLIVLTSDSGCLTILEYDTTRHTFNKLLNYKFGEVGCLFNTPGQYLSVCPSNHYIAICGLNGDILIYPVTYKLSPDCKVIQFNEEPMIQYHIDNSLVYNIVWQDDSVLSLLLCDMQTHIKRIDSYNISTSLLSSFPLSPNNISNNTYTRLISYNEYLLVVCPCLFYVINKRDPNYTDIPSLSYQANESALLSCYAITSLGLIFATDKGGLYYIPPDCDSIIPLQSDKCKNFIYTHMCYDDNYLFLFTEHGENYSLSLSSIKDGRISNNGYIESFRSLHHCTAIKPIKSNASISNYICMNSHGSSSNIALVGLGICCVLKQVSLNTSHLYGAIRHIFAVPDLTVGYDVYAIFSFKEESIIMEVKDTCFKPSHTTHFISDQPTLAVGVMNNYYIQITPDQVICLKADKVYGVWKYSGNGKLINGYIGHHYIILYSEKNEIICLQLNNTIQPSGFTEIEKKTAQSEITCIFEYKDFILVGMVDRSICCYAVEGNLLEEKCKCTVESEPTCIYSFNSITDPQYQQYATSSDDLLFIGCNNGTLITATLKLEEGDLLIISTITISNKPVQMSANIVHGMPLLLVSSHTSYYIIFRNDIFNTIPIFFRSELTKQGEVNLSNHLDNLFVFHMHRTNCILVWQNCVSITVTLETKHPDASVYSEMIGSTGRFLVPIHQECILTIGYDIYSHNYAESQAFLCYIDTNGAFRSTKVDAITRDTTSIITAGCSFQSGKHEEVHDWFATGNHDILANTYCLTLYRGNLSAPIINTRSNITLKEIWKVPMEAKVFFILHLIDTRIAVVCGFYLRIYDTNEQGCHLISQMKITDSFITAIEYENGCFYSIDNTGMITIIRCSSTGQCIVVLKHNTHRSLMRCCVLDDITVAVSDKYGDILIYRSLYQLNDMVDDFKSELLDYRTKSACSMSLIASFYTGALVTSLFKQTSTRHSHSSYLMYSTIYGAISCLLPVEDIDKLKTIVAIESLIMDKDISLVGRNVNDFRSTFVPYMSVVDGDICKKFLELSVDEQKEMVMKLEMSVPTIKQNEMETKLEMSVHKIKQILFELNNI